MKILNPVKNQKGQLGVFVGMSVLIVISLLAFVINVGLFVKAKINLQNAVDAAAYAGAATQARRLTNIAYLNWEMRNTMKEWMFKYYILGNMGNSIVRNNDGSAPLDFRPKPFAATATLNPDAYAKFNIPRNCINFGSTHNICNVFGVPGVPRFPSIGSLGQAELTKEFTDQAVSIKSKNCVDRSVLNFSTTLLWTFGKGGNSAGLADAPQLVGHRVGAWPEALEFAIRMRNLEYLVNRPPVEEGICATEGSNCISLSELKNAAGGTPLNERPIAAFESAFRNLGGGSSTVNGGADHLSIKSTFKLTELAPNAMTFDAKSLSGFLIPPGHSYPGTAFDYSQKHYLDLKILPINYMIFYTTFVPDGEDFSAEIQSEGACKSSITGIPVPFYITGFFKNPEVLTYYAVKGETKYMGLFYPFNKGEGLTIKAYAAAKPMGGRIGPLLFQVQDNSITPRSDDSSRSRGFITAANIGDASTAWKEGMPIPFDPDGEVYLKTDSQVAGGTPESGEDAFFSVPNLVYDYFPGSSTGGSTLIDVISQATTADIDTTARAGLYDGQQYRALKHGMNSSNPSPSDIEGKIIQARRATLFDAMNYLVPTHNNENTNNEAPSIVQGESQIIGSSRYIRYPLYAPLCDDSSIFPYQCNAGDALGTTIREFLKGAEGVLDQYLAELKSIADDMRNKPAVDGGGSNYVDAARSLHPDSTLKVGGAIIYPDDPNHACRTSAALAEKFQIFFNVSISANGEDEPSHCGVTPLLYIITKYIQDKVDNDSSRNFATPEYYIGSSLPSNLMSAFQSTDRKGAGSNGAINHPFLGTAESSGKRNFYSTKLISIKKIFSGADPSSYNDLFPYAERYSGGSLRTGADESIVGGDSNIVNLINSNDLSEFGEFIDTF